MTYRQNSRDKMAELVPTGGSTVVAQEQSSSVESSSSEVINIHFKINSLITVSACKVVSFQAVSFPKFLTVSCFQPIKNSSPEIFSSFYKNLSPDPLPYNFLQSPLLNRNIELYTLSQTPTKLNVTVTSRLSTRTAIKNVSLLVSERPCSAWR